MGFQIFRNLFYANKSGYSDGALLTSHSRFNAHLSTDQHRAGSGWHCQGCQTPAGQAPEVSSCSVRALQDPSQQCGSRSWWCPPGGTGAGLEPSTLPGPAAAASDGLTGPSSPRGEQDPERRPGPARGSIRPCIQRDRGEFVPGRTERDLFVSQCRFLPPFLSFRFLPAPQEPEEPAAPCGAGSLGRRGSALPAAARTVLFGAVPERRAGVRRDFALRICSAGPHSPRRSPRGESCSPRQWDTSPPHPSPAGLGTGRATHRTQSGGLNVPAGSRPGPPEGLEGVGRETSVPGCRSDLRPDVAAHARGSWKGPEPRSA